MKVYITYDEWYPFPFIDSVDEFEKNWGYQLDNPKEITEDLYLEYKAAYKAMKNVTRKVEEVYKEPT